ncbi:MAG: nuclear pore complex subunit, partial [Bacteroidetes bacterium HGW-Bacteroidetes-15]
MSKLFIEETNKTPEIDFNLEKGVLSISGVSVPENAHDFYFPTI